jgi:copper transport protein
MYSSSALSRTPFHAARRLAVLCALLFAMFSLAGPQSASAHNRDRTSEPENGEVLRIAPKQVTFWFKAKVGQDSATVFLIEPSGTRTPLTILKAGQLELVAALPLMPDGVYSVRWKLISSDGHPVTNKISFTVATGSSVVEPLKQPSEPIVSVTSVAPNTAPTVPQSVATVSVLSTTVPLSPTTFPPTRSAPIVAQKTVALDLEGIGGAPNWVRWLLRFGSYAMIFGLIGTAATASFVWPELLKTTWSRRLIVRTLVGVFVFALLQLVVLAKDIDAGSPLKSLQRVTSFDVGWGLLARIVLALLTLVAFVRSRAQTTGVAHRLLVASVGLLATWSYVGHAKSQRWPWIGMPVDIAHHASGAAWIGALAIVGFSAIPQAQPKHRVRIMKRLASFAFSAVLIVIATGIVQSIRLVGSPANLFDAGHSRLLVVKIVLVCAMLGIADRNRRSVASIVALNEAETDSGTLRRLRQMVGREFLLGVLTVAITSSLVVRPPAISAAAEVSNADPSLVQKYR